MKTKEWLKLIQSLSNKGYGYQSDKAKSFVSAWNPKNGEETRIYENGKYVNDINNLRVVS